MRNKIYAIFGFIFLIISNIESSFAIKKIDEANEAASKNMNILQNMFTTEMLMNAFFAISIFIGTILGSKVIPKLAVSRMEKIMMRDGSNDNIEELAGVISRSVSILIFTVGFSAMLTILGVDMSIFMGGVGFGIGFTMKVFLSNFVAGIIMVTQGTYHMGDVIEIGGKLGKIKKIYSLFTAVEQFDGVIYYVANIKFLEENVSNYHTNDKRRVDVECLVDYKTDIVKAKQIMIQIAGQFPKLLKNPQPNVIVKELADSGILLILRVWISSTDSYIGMKSNLTETINMAFQKSDIDIPYPHIKLINK